MGYTSKKDFINQLEWDQSIRDQIKRENKSPYFTLNPKIEGKCICGGNYVLRQNRKNKEYFYGCSNYPNCKNTQSITYEMDYLSQRESRRKEIKSQKSKFDPEEDKLHTDYLEEKKIKQQKWREEAKARRLAYEKKMRESLSENDYIDDI